MTAIQLFLVIVAADLAAGYVRNIIARVWHLYAKLETVVVHNGKSYVSVGQ